MANASVDNYIEKLRNLSAFGLKFAIEIKLRKHYAARNVRAIRTYLACLKVAHPNLKVSETVDPLIIRDLRKVLDPYYIPNREWKEGDSVWKVFLKIKEPPK